MKTLVAYYSRTGRTKKGAQAIAGVLDADLFEISDRRRGKGPIGFIKAFRDNQKGRTYPVSAPVNLETYDRVILCTPVWIELPASPIISFLKSHGSKIKNISYLVVQMLPTDYPQIPEKMDAWGGVSHDRVYFGFGKSPNFEKNCEAFAAFLNEPLADDKSRVFTLAIDEAALPKALRQAETQTDDDTQAP